MGILDAFNNPGMGQAIADSLERLAAASTPGGSLEGVIQAQYARQRQAQQDQLLRQLTQQQIQSGALDLKQKQLVADQQAAFMQKLQNLAAASAAPQIQPLQSPDGGGAGSSLTNPVWNWSGNQINAAQANADAQKAQPAQPSALGQAGNSFLSSLPDSLRLRYMAAQDPSVGPAMLSQVMGEIKSYKDMMPKSKAETMLGRDQQGNLVQYSMDDQGNVRSLPFTPAQKVEWKDVGNQLMPVGEYGDTPTNAKPMAMGMSPYQKQELGIRGAELGLAQKRLAMEQRVQDPFGMLGVNPQPVSTQAGAMSAPTGDAFLSTLPPAMAAQVKALAEGRMAFPTGFAMKSPQMQALLQAVGQYDPSFDAINYNARAATRKSFTSGKDAQTINSLNTALGHVGDFLDAAKNLNNSSFTPLNAVENYIASATGNPNVNQFKAAQTALSGEILKAFNNGHITEGELKALRDQMSANASPAQLRGVATMFGHLLQSKIEALGENYSRGMGTVQNGMNLLNPHAQAVMNNLMGQQQQQPAPANPNIDALVQKYAQ